MKVLQQNMVFSHTYTNQLIQRKIIFVMIVNEISLEDSIDEELNTHTGSTCGNCSKMQKVLKCLKSLMRYLTLYIAMFINFLHVLAKTI